MRHVIQLKEEVEKKTQSLIVERVSRDDLTRYKGFLLKFLAAKDNIRDSIKDQGLVIRAGGWILDKAQTLTQR